MAIQLGSAYGKVSIDSSGVASGVNSAIGSMSKLAGVATALGNTLTNVGNSMTIGLTLPILAMGAASIKAASDYEETKNKAVVVFGEMADAIVENSDRAASALGLSKQQYLDYAASLGAAFKAGGMGIKESTELAEQAVKHFADLASFHNAEVQDVAAAWQSAIRGQYEPIQRYFPFITDSYLKTYGIANNLVDANTKNLTANQRAIILNAIAFNEELNPAVNDFAETSKGLANSTRIMKAEFQNALVTLGTNLLPIALKVVQGLNRMLEAFNAMPPGVQKAIIIFAGFLAVLGPILSFLGTIISFIGGIMSLATTLGGLGISFAAVASAVGAAGSMLLAFAGAALSALGSILLLAAGPVLLYLAFKNNFMGITTTAKQLWFIIKYYFSEGWKWLMSSVQQGGTRVAEWFRNMTQKIVDYFKRIKWSDIGKFIILGIVNGLLGGLPLVIAAAAKVAAAALKAAKSKLGVKSPSTEFMKIGAFSGQGFRMGLEKMMDPSAIARTMAKPSNSFVTSSRTNYQMNFGNGLTVRDVDRLMEQKLANFTRQLNKAVGAA